jgi:site-specific DNA recombinase
MKKPAPQKLSRCAIYTRKSTEHNLDLEFNSLDAQREACEAYIKSQAHEGWRLIPDHYDDGGLSGASLDRPSLQTLLTDIRARKIDIVVVYKVDRLTRALGDFAKLVELFDEHGVTFVSITQSFNTTSSMGRLTLNVLLSFAQFEREVIGERVRDKIAASKRKGIWVGGGVLLGYASVNKKLVVVPHEAETVRTIFRRYLELGSIAALAQDLEMSGISARRRVLSTGRIRGGTPFRLGGLIFLLRNRFFIGDVVYRGEVYRGEHEPILDRALFEAVQATLAAKAVRRQAKLRGSPAILMGRIFDDHGNRMSPSHANKLGVRYRYYVSHAVVQGRRADSGSVTRVPGPEVEAQVIAAVRMRLQPVNGGDDAVPLSDRELIERHVERVVIRQDAIEILPLAPANPNDHSLEVNDTKAINMWPAIILPWTPPGVTSDKGVVHAPRERTVINPEARAALLEAIAKARVWIDELVTGQVESLAEIARRERKVERHVLFLAPLAFASPKMIAETIQGDVPTDLTVTRLATALPYSWLQQLAQKLVLDG